jgi:hypothetical protein
VAEGVLRYEVSSADSSLTFEAKSTLHALHGQATGLGGFVEAGWSADGTLDLQPQPQMHVEFPVAQLRSGNDLQDREMLKVIDGKRFPRVAADLRGLEPGATPATYKASGDITLAGRSRRYDGEFAIAHDEGRVTVDGELNLDIRDFGIKPPNLLVVKVDPLVRVRLRLVARKAT